MTPTLADIRTAHERIAGAIVNTPCRKSQTLSQITGANVLLKFENHQFTASFKERGALNKLLLLDESARANGVIAMSAGNHAQGVAYHARRLGIPATIVMPEDTPFVKIEQTRLLGPRVLLEGKSLSEAEDHALAVAKKEGLTFIHPYDDPQIIAGQGTIAIEMLNAVPNLDIILVPAGGGGLISGVAIAAKGIKPQISIVGVESETYPAIHAALHGEHPVMGGPSIAEGIAVTRSGTTTLPIIRALVDDTCVVSETEIERAILMLLDIEKTVVEGAGAVGLAALLHERDRFADKNVGVVLSGGNIDARVLSSIILRGLAAEGRLSRVLVEITDTPGKLAEVSQIIGDSGANIVEVYHERYFSKLPIKSTALIVIIESRNLEHAERIVACLTDAGFPSRMLGLPGQST